MQRNATFYYRRRIPQEVAEYFPICNEIRLRLSAKSLKKAILETNKINLLFEELVLTLQLDTFEKKEQIVDEYIAMMKDAYKEAYFTGQRKGMINKSNLLLEQLQCEQAIQSGISHLASSQIEDVFTQANIDPAAIDSKTYKQIETLYLHKKISMLEELIRIIDPRKDLNHYDSSTVEIKAKHAGITFKQLYELFLEEKRRESPNLSKTTWRDYSTAFDDFIYVIEDAEDRDIASFAKQDFRTFVNALHDHLPKSRTKKPEFRELPYSLLKNIELKPEEKMAHETKKKKMGTIKAIFDLAIDERNDYLSDNYAKPFLLDNSKKKRGKRYPLSDDNLIKLFNSKLFTNPRIKQQKPHQYWIPIIALYTGMRQNEICQLYISDVKQEIINNNEPENVIWYFDLNEDGDKRLKTENSTRLVPLHPILIELGFIDYFNSIKETSNRVWPQLRFHPSEERYNTDYNKTFLQFFRAYVTDELTQVFHSIRHNVGDQLVKNAVHHKLPKDLMNQIMGHEPDKDMTTAVYSQGYGVKELYEGIKTLTFNVSLDGNIFLE